MQFAEAFPDVEIVASLMRQLSWTHFIKLLPMKGPLQREFCAQMCRTEHWSVRELGTRIESMLYQRTALSKELEALIKQELGKLAHTDEVSSALLLKEPYVLDFLELNDRYLEKDLKDAIWRDLESFLLELGAGFSFIARQKCIQIDGEDFHIDLLFYDLRTNKHFTLKQRLPSLDDMQDFIACYRLKRRKETERFKFYKYADLMARDKASLDVFWLKDDSLDNLDNLPPPAILQAEIIEHLEAALQSFRDVAAGLPEPE